MKKAIAASADSGSWARLSKAMLEAVAGGTWVKRAQKRGTRTVRRRKMR